MNAPVKSIDIQPSRRQVLTVSAAMVGGALLVGCSPATLLSIGAKDDFGAFGPFIKIAQDGSVTVISKHIEFGQGNHAGLAAIVTEELGADWDKAMVEQAPANAKVDIGQRQGLHELHLWRAGHWRLIGDRQLLGAIAQGRRRSPGDVRHRRSRRLEGAGG